MIGAGSRGQAFARRCLQAGYAVYLEDVLSSNLRSAEQSLKRPSNQRGGELFLVSSVEEAVRTADIAIDFVPDELESKLEILSMMDRMAPPRTIFCTPTHLSLTDLASCTYRAAQCLALEPFGEAVESELVLVYGALTAEGTVLAAAEWCKALGIQVRRVQEQAEVGGKLR